MSWNQTQPHWALSTTHLTCVVDKKKKRLLLPQGNKKKMQWAPKTSTVQPASMKRLPACCHENICPSDSIAGLSHMTNSPPIARLCVFVYLDSWRKLQTCLLSVRSGEWGWISATGVWQSCVSATLFHLLQESHQHLVRRQHIVLLLKRRWLISPTGPSLSRSPVWRIN